MGKRQRRGTLITYALIATTAVVFVTTWMVFLMISQTEQGHTNLLAPEPELERTGASAGAGTGPVCRWPGAGTGISTDATQQG